MSKDQAAPKRRKRMWPIAVLGGLSITACASFEALVYVSDCLKVAIGEMEIDCEDRTWRMNGVCVSVKHAACQPLSSVSLEIGTDMDGDGKLGPGEPSTRVSDASPGMEICLGSLQGELGAGGKNFVVSLEAYQQGGTQPALSKNEIYPLD